MARKTRRQKERAATRQPALAQTRPRSAPATPGAAMMTAATTSGSRPAPADTPSAPPVSDQAGRADPGPPGDEGSARRRVERIVPGAGAAAAPARPQRSSSVQRARFGSAASMVAPLESSDPAIPFDRVPYVPADLRRVAIMAGVMVALILIAWVVVAVTHVTS